MRVGAAERKGVFIKRLRKINVNTLLTCINVFWKLFLRSMISGPFSPSKSSIMRKFLAAAAAEAGPGLF